MGRSEGSLVIVFNCLAEATSSRRDASCSFGLSKARALPISRRGRKFVTNRSGKCLMKKKQKNNFS